MNERGKALTVLAANTVAFTVCFSVWTLYGVLVTFLAEQQVYQFGKIGMGWLIGIPVLSGALFRLPAGMLADRYGGRPVYALIMLFSAGCAWLASYADTFAEFLAAGLGFGLAGSVFSVGVAYTSLWFPQRQQGTALGVFGAGTVGAAITALVAPLLLASFTAGGTRLDSWRLLPRVYALALAVTAALFWFFTFSRKPQGGVRSLIQRLSPLRSVRVWRFGLYYFLTFGAFVALSQWLIPYYVNVYALSVAAAGAFTSLFALPSGLLRAFGGWLADRIGARNVMYAVLSGCAVVFLLLAIPRMDLESIGEGVAATEAGTVTAVSPAAITVGETRYVLREAPAFDPDREGAGFWPVKLSWQEPIVQPGDRVPKRALLARGYTRIHFHANMAVFTGLVLLAGTFMGMGSGAVFKHIPHYFPDDVGTVGGLVGVIGGLGGFVGPILFGYLLQWTGIWTTNWIFLFGVSVVCLGWMYLVIKRMMADHAPEVATHIDRGGVPVPLSLQVRCPVHGVRASLRVLATADGSTPPVIAACSLLSRGNAGTCEGRCVVGISEAPRPAPAR